MSRASGLKELVESLQELLARPDGSADMFYVFFAPTAGEPVLTEVRTLEDVKNLLRRQLADKAEGWYSMVRGRRWSLLVDCERGLGVVQEPTGQEHMVLPEIKPAEGMAMQVVVFPAVPAVAEELN